jgi:hypothetical protein
MKLSLFFVIAACMLIGVEAARGEGTEKDRKSFLPGEALGWRWDGKGMNYHSRALFEYIDGAAELYLAYGFENLAARRYEKPQQPPITVELYELASPEDAYGVFSFERQDEPAGIGQGSEFGGGLLRFWKGRYFVSAYADGEGKETEAAVVALGRATADLIPETGPEPKLVGLIPGREFGLQDRGIRYLKSHVLLNQRFFIAHQNILNLSRRTEAVLAPYLRDRQTSHLVLIRYADSKEANDALRSFLKTYLPDTQGNGIVKTEDGKWTAARRRNEFVLIVFAASSQSDAEILLKAVEDRL